MSKIEPPEFERDVQEVQYYSRSTFLLPLAIPMLFILIMILSLEMGGSSTSENYSIEECQSIDRSEPGPIIDDQYYEMLDDCSSYMYPETYKSGNTNSGASKSTAKIILIINQIFIFILAIKFYRVTLSQYGDDLISSQKKKAVSVAILYFVIQSLLSVFFIMGTFIIGI
jgi:hypothetical protein